LAAKEIAITDCRKEIDELISRLHIDAKVLTKSVTQVSLDRHGVFQQRSVASGGCVVKKQMISIDLIYPCFAIILPSDGKCRLSEL
jgi:hypothetical protein